MCSHQERLGAPLSLRDVLGTQDMDFICSIVNRKPDNNVKAR
jgi:hypothetical protein